MPFQPEIFPHMRLRSFGGLPNTLAVTTCWYPSGEATQTRMKPLMPSWISR